VERVVEQREKQREDQERLQQLRDQQRLEQERIKQQQDQLRHDLDKLAHEQAKLRQGWDGLRTKNDDLTQHVAKFRAQQDQLSDEKAALDKLRQEIDRWKQEKQRAEAVLLQKGESLANDQRALEDAETRLAKERTDLEREAAEFREMQKAGHSRTDSEQQDLRKEIESLRQQLVQEKRERHESLENLDRQAASFAKQRNDFQDEINTLQKQTPATIAPAELPRAELPRARPTPPPIAPAPPPLAPVEFEEKVEDEAELDIDRCAAALAEFCEQVEADRQAVEKDTEQLQQRKIDPENLAVHEAAPLVDERAMLDRIREEIQREMNRLQQHNGSKQQRPRSVVAQPLPAKTRGTLHGLRKWFGRS